MTIEGLIFPGFVDVAARHVTTWTYRLGLEKSKCARNLEPAFEISNSPLSALPPFRPTLDKHIRPNLSKMTPATPSKSMLALLAVSMQAAHAPDQNSPP